MTSSPPSSSAPSVSSSSSLRSSKMLCPGGITYVCFMNLRFTVTFLVLPLLCIVKLPCLLLLLFTPSVLDKSNLRSYFIVLESLRVVVHSDWLSSSGIDAWFYTLIVLEVCSIAVVLSLILLAEPTFKLVDLLPGSIVNRSAASLVRVLAILGKRFIVLLSYFPVVLSEAMLLSVIGRCVFGV